jgi:aspartate carbamoyltransferase catalytic subunit
MKKVPLLREQMFNLFFENSTRTRTTFEIAESACRPTSSISTSTRRPSRATLLDTVDNLVAMNRHVRRPPFTVRRAASIAAHLGRQRTHVHVVNAGDGRHAHPRRACSTSTIRHYKRGFSGSPLPWSATSCGRALRAR